MICLRVFMSLLIITLSTSAYSQKIRYNIPSGYENAITKSDYKNLVDLVLPIIREHYEIESLDDGTIKLKSNQKISQVNLHNIITKCAKEDKSIWRDIIETHFDNLFVSLEEQKKIDYNNFEAVKKYLSLRIYPTSTIQSRGGPNAIVCRQDLEGTYTVLMVDLPGAFTPLQKDLPIKWGKDNASLFSIAQTNVNRQHVEQLTENVDVEGSKLELHFIAEDNYAASVALDLENNLPKFVGEWGAVVTFPNKALVTACKVSSKNPVDFVTFIQLTKELNERYYSEHEQPISDQFFWYYKGIFTRIQVNTDKDGNISVISPAGLTELMTISK